MTNRLRVPIAPQMLRWAQQRAGVDHLAMNRRFSKWDKWLSGEVSPTFRQLEAFARATHTPIGYLFLPEPPEERLPIPDFRTVANREVREPSPNLLDTLYICQQRQAWYAEHARANAFPTVDFVGSVSTRTPPVTVAGIMRERLDFDLDARRHYRSWEEALRTFIALVDQAGVMVMCSGVVLNNNHRRLDPEEFRGFAFADTIAPLIFINGSDSKSAQMFTLAHELAHLWLGNTALSNPDMRHEETQAVERWCNAVAAEFLVPLAALGKTVDKTEAVDLAKTRLAREFKVSTLVVLSRLRDIGFVSANEFPAIYQAELDRIRVVLRNRSGGNFYLSQASRVSKRFAKTLCESALEGQTLYRDAMKMLGISKVETFNNLGRSLHIPM